MATVDQHLERVENLLQPSPGDGWSHVSLKNQAAEALAVVRALRKALKQARKNRAKGENG